MKKLLFSIMILVLLMCGSAFDAEAATYYVAQTAAGDETGSSYANRMGEAAFEGGDLGALSDDTVYICNAWNVSLKIPSGGTDGYPATFRGDYAGQAYSFTDTSGTYAIYQEGDKDYINYRNFTIAGPGTDYGVGVGVGLSIRGDSTNKPDNIHIDGCTISGFYFIGISFEYGGNNSSVTNCTIFNCGNAMYIVSGDGNGYYLIANNLTYDISYDENYHLSNGNIQDGHAFSNQSSSYNIIRDNLFIRSGSAAVYIGGGYQSENANFNVLSNNIISDNAKAYLHHSNSAGIGVIIHNYLCTDCTEYNIISRNIIDTSNTGIKPSYSNSGNYYYNNTLYNCGIPNVTYDAAIFMKGTVAGGDAENHTLKNNIISATDTSSYHIFQEDDIGTNTFDYNLYYTDFNGFVYHLQAATDFEGWQVKAGTTDPSGIGDLDPSFTTNPTGTHDGANNAAILTDSGESWKINAHIGKAIYNTPDDSIGKITANSATTITATLIGGTDNDWDSSDTFVIHDYTLTSGSPAKDAGYWLTTITSSTDTGQTSFVVADPYYFHDGFGLVDIDGTAEVGQTIKTAGGEVTVVTDINYGTSTLTVSPAIDIVQNEGVSVCDKTICYTGVFPDIGAKEIAVEPQHTNPLVTVTPDDSTYTTGDAVVYSATITYDGSATGSTFLWDYGGQDEAVAALATNVEDPGTVDPTTEVGAFSQSFTVLDTLGGSTTVNWTLTIQATNVYDDLTFYWTADAADFSGTNDIFDYSAGDDIGVLEDEAVMHVDAKYMGATNGLKCVDGGGGIRDRILFDANLSNIWDGDDIALAFPFKITGWSNGQELLKIIDGGGDFLEVECVDNDEISVSWKDAGVTKQARTTDCNLSTNTWYICHVWCDPGTGNDLNVVLYTGDGNLTQVGSTETDTTAKATIDPIDQIYVGNSDNNLNLNAYIGGLVISEDHNDPVHQWVELKKYPKGKWIESITQVSPDGTYGESDTIQCSVNLNPLCGGGTVTDTDAGSDNDMTLSSTLDVGAALAWTADSAYDTALYHHLFTATVVAATTEADLTITSLADGADTADFDLTTIPTNLAASAAIVIDTTANTFITLFHSDSSGTIIAGAATYTSGYFYLTLQGSGGQYLQFKDGPLSNIVPTAALDYGGSLTATVYNSLDGTSDLIVLRYNVDDVAGARAVALIMGESALPHGTTKIVDTSPAENELSSYNYPDTTAITGGVITIASPLTLTVGTGGNYATLAAAKTALDHYVLDTFNYVSDSFETVDLTDEPNFTINANSYQLIGAWTIDGQTLNGAVIP